MRAQEAEAAMKADLLEGAEDEPDEPDAYLDVDLSEEAARIAEYAALIAAATAGGAKRQ